MFEVLGFFGFFKIIYDLLSIFTGLVFVIGFGVILYELSCKNGLEGKALLSFIPIGNIYIMNKLLGERVHVRLRKLLWIYYGIFYILSFFISKFSIAALAILIYYMYLMLKEFKGMENKKIFWLHIIFAVLTNGLSFIFSVYKYRTNDIEVCESVRDKNNDESIKDSFSNLKIKAGNFISDLVNASSSETENKTKNKKSTSKGRTRNDNVNVNVNVNEELNDFSVNSNSNSTLISESNNYIDDDDDFNLYESDVNSTEVVKDSQSNRKGINL